MGDGALAAEGRLEKSSFEFRSEGIGGFRLSNGIRKAIPDLRASSAEATRREDIGACMVHQISVG